MLIRLFDTDFEAVEHVYNLLGQVDMDFEQRLPLLQYLSTHVQQ